MEKRWLPLLLVVSVLVNSCRPSQRSRLNDDRASNLEHEINQGEYDQAPTDTFGKNGNGGSVQGTGSPKTSPQTHLDFGDMTSGQGGGGDGPELTGETFKHGQANAPTTGRSGPRDISIKGEPTREKRRTYSLENDAQITAQIEKEKPYLHSMRDGLSTYSGTLTEAEQSYNGRVRSLLAGVGPLLSEPVHEPQKDFKTPAHTVPGKRLENAWAYRNQVKVSVDKDTSSAREPRKQLLDFADVNLDLADDAYSEKSPYFNAGDHHLKTALAVLDVIMTFTPGVSGVYDVTQLVTGKSVTGELLSESDRAVILATIMLPTVASSSLRYLKRGLDAVGTKRPLARDLRRLIDKFDLMPQLEKLGLSDAKSIRENAKVIRSLPGDATEVRAVATDALNAADAISRPGSQKSYNSGRIAIEYTSGSQDVFGRVYNDERKMVGQWVGRMEDMQGKSSAQIKTDFALPNMPTFMAKATIPAKTPMRVSEVGLNDWGGNSQKIQFEIMIDNIPEDWFEKIRDVP